MFSLYLIRTISLLNHRQTLIQLKSQAFKISGCLLLFSAEISSNKKTVLLRQRKVFSRKYEKLWNSSPKSSISFVIKRRWSQLFHIFRASNPPEQLDFRSRFLCLFQTANQKIQINSKILWPQSPSILMPRPRRLRDEKRVMGTRKLTDPFARNVIFIAPYCSLCHGVTPCKSPY